MAETLVAEGRGVSHIPQVGDAGDAARDATNTKKSFSIFFNLGITRYPLSPSPDNKFSMNFSLGRVREMHLPGETQDLLERRGISSRDAAYLTASLRGDARYLPYSSPDQNFSTKFSINNPRISRHFLRKNKFRSQRDRKDPRGSHLPINYGTT